MKLAAKLTAFILTAILLVFVVRGFQSARRQMDITDRRVRENVILVARALRPALVKTWTEQGESAGLDMLEHVSDEVRRLKQIGVRFVSLPESPTPGREPLVGVARLSALSSKQDLTLEEMVAGTEQVLTYLPVQVSGRVVGALEVSSVLTEREDEYRGEILQIILRTSLAALAAFVAVAFVGILFVGRPMRRLVEKARRVGTGDLSGPLDLRQRDEMGELAGEMNQMCERLAAAQKQLESEIEGRLAASEQLRHADRLTTIGKLASGVAHELGTPLNVVSGRAKMIVRGQVTGPDLLESAQAIVDQADRMTTIIKQLLGFARRRQPQRRHESLRGVVERTLTLLAPMAERNGIVFSAVNNDPEAHAEIDISQVEQALTNLVVNAIQAMPKGGVITIRSCQEIVSPPVGTSAPEGTYACLHVEDTGMGMDSEQLKHAFEPFFTTKDVGAGTGLGLPVAYGIVRDHGGWIAATSTVAKGSRFSMYLPVARASEDDHA